MNGYVIAGYGITVATIVAYAARLLIRERALARALDGRRRDPR